MNGFVCFLVAFFTVFGLSAPLLGDSSDQSEEVYDFNPADSPRSEQWWKGSHRKVANRIFERIVKVFRRKGYNKAVQIKWEESELWVSVAHVRRAKDNKPDEVILSDHLFEMVKNEHELAAILAHEVAHLYSWQMQAISSEEVSAEEQLFRQWQDEGLGVSNFSFSRWVQMRAQSEPAFRDLLEDEQRRLFYTDLIYPMQRAEEREADRLGIVVMEQAGFDCRRAEGKFQHGVDLGWALSDRSREEIRYRYRDRTLRETLDHDPPHVRLREFRQFCLDQKGTIEHKR